MNVDCSAWRNLRERNEVNYHTIEYIFSKTIVSQCIPSSRSCKRLEELQFLAEFGEMKLSGPCGRVIVGEKIRLCKCMDLVRHHRVLRRLDTAQNAWSIYALQEQLRSRSFNKNKNLMSQVRKINFVLCSVKDQREISCGKITYLF